MSFQIEHHTVIRSTNDRAKELAAEGKRYICVVADSQTGGRGRSGRPFYSPPGSGLYLSVILPPEDLALMTVRAAVYVAETVEALSGAQAGIKWVNDILLCGKKVCGILAEGAFGPDGKPAYAVVGIGINLLRTVFPEELKPIAGDIETLSGKRVDGNELLMRLLDRFRTRNESRESVLSSYRSRCVTLGQSVTVIRGAERFLATALSVDDGGGLWVDRDGERILLQSGEVSVRPDTRTGQP